MKSLRVVVHVVTIVVCCQLCCVVVFFFKQKTAYEMRISDWSSDVCSSDLRGKAATEAGHFQREIVGVEIDTPDGRQTHLVDEGIRFDATLEGIAGVKIQIGSASCRERVCQYV